MMSAVIEQRPSAMQRATQGDADAFSLPVSYTHLTLPTICSV